MTADTAALLAAIDDQIEAERQRRARAEADLDLARSKLEQLRESVRERYDCELEDLQAMRDAKYEELTALVSQLQSTLQELES